jgi:hypothetical protein
MCQAMHNRRYAKSNNVLTVHVGIITPIHYSTTLTHDPIGSSCYLRRSLVNYPASECSCIFSDLLDVRSDASPTRFACLQPIDCRGKVSQRASYCMDGPNVYVMSRAERVFIVRVYARMLSYENSTREKQLPQVLDEGTIGCLCSITKNTNIMIM